MSRHRYDVAVVGAGPAGVAAAMMAAASGLSVALIDGGPRALPNVGESLPAAAKKLLRALGIEDVLAGHDPCLGNVSAWGGPRLETMDALQDPAGHGWHLDRRAFDGALRERAEHAVAAVVRMRVRGVAADDDGLRLDGDGFSVNARMVIDATGRRARIAQALGARRTQDDELVALCCWAEASDEMQRDRRTLLETCPAGWWYTAALPDGTRSVVLHTDADVARRLADPDRWRALLRCTRHVRRFVGGGRWLAHPRGTAASGAHLDHCTGDRWLAVGDAALSFDPVSSQGIFNALYTGMRAAQAVAGHLDGDTDGLPAYARRLTEIRDAYLRRCRHVYAAETRWLVAPFWQQRVPRGRARAG